MTLGLSTVVSAICSAVAIFLGRRGKQKVDRGDTRKHRGLAQAGFVTGLVGLGLSIVATVGWILLALNDDFQRGFQEGLEGNQSSVVVPGLARGAAMAGRALLG